MIRDLFLVLAGLSANIVAELLILRWQRKLDLWKKRTFFLVAAGLILVMVVFVVASHVLTSIHIKQEETTVTLPWPVVFKFQAVRLSPAAWALLSALVTLVASFMLRAAKVFSRTWQMAWGNPEHRSSPDHMRASDLIAGPELSIIGMTIALFKAVTSYPFVWLVGTFIPLVRLYHVAIMILLFFISVSVSVRAQDARGTTRLRQAWRCNAIGLVALYLGVFI